MWKKNFQHKKQTVYTDIVIGFNERADTTDSQLTRVITRASLENQQTWKNVQCVISTIHCHVGQGCIISSCTA